jgi:hypothetical protein
MKTNMSVRGHAAQSEESKRDACVLGKITWASLLRGRHNCGEDAPTA